MGLGLILSLDPRGGLPSKLLLLGRERIDRRGADAVQLRLHRSLSLPLGCQPCVPRLGRLLCGLLAHRILLRAELVDGHCLDRGRALRQLLRVLQKPLLLRRLVRETLLLRLHACDLMRSAQVVLSSCRHVANALLERRVLGFDACSLPRLCLGALLRELTPRRLVLRV